MDNPHLPRPVRAWLQTALSDWQQQGIVTPEQASRIQSLYPPEEPDAPGKQNRILYVLGAMAAFLFGAALLLVIGYNWSEMPREAKLGIMLAGTALVHGLGFWFHRRLDWPLAGEIAHFLGCIVYGAGIWLVAQAYHLDAHYPDGMWWWALGVLPLVILSGAPLYHLLYVGLLAVWCGMEVLGFQNPSDTILFGWTNLPHGAYTLLLLILPGFFWAYKKTSSLLLGLYLPLVAWWCFLQAITWHASTWTFFWVGGVGSVLLLLAQVHQPGNRMAIPFRLWGTLLTLGAWLFISSNTFWKELHHIRGGSDHFYHLWFLNMILCAITFMAVIAILTLAWLRARRNPSYKPDLTRQWLPAALAITTAVFGYLGLVGEQAALPAMVFGNLAILAIAILLVRVGVLEERLQPFAGGILCFLIWMLVRYFDLFDASWGMLGAAGIFTLAGIGLLAVGKFWAATSGTHKAAIAEGGPAQSTLIWPGWVDRCLAWTTAHGQALLVAIVGLQLAVVGGMVALEQYSMANAQTVFLNVVPVDPRDFFRGDYVVLGYDFDRVIRRDLPGGSNHPFVSLAPSADGKVWEATQASNSRPDKGIYLEGKINRWSAWGFSRPLFGIEAFYVQEGQGKQWEKAIREKKVLAKVLVAPSGKARLKELIAE